LKGPVQIFWAFPVVLAVFFLLVPREAVIACALMIAGLLPLVYGKMEDITLTSFLITLLVTMAFAYAFSVLTSEQRDQLVNLATRDPLTGAGNRRALEERLAQIIALHGRAPVTASMLVLDLDHFKQINDEHGHDVGDRILVAITRLIENRIRVTDRLYRVGGEEFVVLTEGDDLDKATALAEDLRVLVEGSRLDGRCDVTVSQGVAQLAVGETDKEWFRRADLALYEAKNSGRNRVAIAA
jgi:diguanylate cyclase (GGDEF)-like protein